MPELISAGLAPASRPGRFDAVLFDCDGVLVDSESITNGVLRDMLADLGWELSLAECMRTFVGKAVKDEAALIHARTGQPITDAWLAEFRERRNAALSANVRAVEGALAAVATLHARYAGRIACCTGADRIKCELQLRQCGLMPFFEGRVFTGHEMPRSKPAPDVYLAAMRQLGVAAARCVVIEDTVTGATAGVAAGATVFGYSPPDAGHDAPAALRQAGAAVVFTHMAALPSLVDA